MVKLMVASILLSFSGSSFGWRFAFQSRSPLMAWRKTAFAPSTSFSALTTPSTRPIFSA
ncbi:Uncharacterised protein [Shigella sonnei]|nr:Uncharacterised protein [Shigella sonnei]